MAKILKNGDYVYLEGWTGIYGDETAMVCTVIGMALAKGKARIEAYEDLEQAVQRGHDVVWTYKEGACLYGDRREAIAASARRAERRNSAILLKHGETVPIEGMRFTVSINRGNEHKPYNCDPISFIYQ